MAAQRWVESVPGVSLGCQTENDIDTASGYHLVHQSVLDVSGGSVLAHRLEDRFAARSRGEQAAEGVNVPA